MTGPEDNVVRLSELRPGDILLHNGTSWISALILVLDGGEYSHASIYVGKRDSDERTDVPSIVEATIPQVHYEDLVSRVEHHDNFIDVFRWHSLDKDEIGSEGFPARPVLEQGDGYVGHEYAYHQLVFVALLIVTRMLGKKLSKTQKLVVRLGTKALDTMIGKGQRQLVCSELVYRCFNEAETPAPYRLSVGGGYLERMSLAAAGDWKQALGEPDEPTGPDSDHVDELLEKALSEIDLEAAGISLPEEGPLFEGASLRGVGVAALENALERGDDADDDVAIREEFLALYSKPSASEQTDLPVLLKSTATLASAGARAKPQMESPPELVSPQMISESKSVSRVGRLQVEM